MSKFLNLNWNDIFGAIILSTITAVLTYIGSLTNIFTLDIKSLVSIIVLTASASLLNSLTTTNTGKFLGVVKIK